MNLKEATIESDEEGQQTGTAPPFGSGPASARLGEGTIPTRTWDTWALYRVRTVGDVV
jgi:hypothetical protein